MTTPRGHDPRARQPAWASGDPPTGLVPRAQASLALATARVGPRVASWRPVTVGLVAAGLALGFVVLRLAIAADGDVTRFVVAGEAFVEPGHGVHVFPSTGYDGQFFWRLAVDPTDWSRTDGGVTFDNAYRPPRIGYPLLAHMVALGRPGLVPWALVAVNVAAVGVIAGVGGRLARDAGHPAAWGLLVAGSPGLVMAVGRDLAEGVTVACLLAGILALRHDRPWVATALWSYAVLTREQALLTVGAYALWRLTRRRGGTGGPAVGVRDLVWVVPVGVFVAWQAVLWASTGDLPAARAGGSNLVPPFSALVPGVAEWATGGLPRLHAAAPLQLAATVALVVAAARVARQVPSDLGFVVVALAAATLASTCLAASVWRDPSDMRHLVDVSTYAAVALVSAHRAPPRWVGFVVTTVWAITVTVRTVAP